MPSKLINLSHGKDHRVHKKYKLEIKRISTSGQVELSRVLNPLFEVEH